MNMEQSSETILQYSLKLLDIVFPKHADADGQHNLLTRSLTIFNLTFAGGNKKARV